MPPATLVAGGVSPRAFTPFFSVVLLCRGLSSLCPIARAFTSSRMFVIGLFMSVTASLCVLGLIRIGASRWVGLSPTARCLMRLLDLIRLIGCFVLLLVLVRMTALFCRRWNPRLFGSRSGVVVVC